MTKWAGSHGVWKTLQAVHAGIAREFCAILKDTHMCHLSLIMSFGVFSFIFVLTGRNFHLDK